MQAILTPIANPAGHRLIVHKKLRWIPLACGPKYKKFDQELRCRGCSPLRGQFRVLFLLTRVAFAAIITGWWYVARVSVWHTIHTDCRNCHIPIAPSPSSLTFLIGPPGCLSILSGQHQNCGLSLTTALHSQPLSVPHRQRNVLNVGGFQVACAFVCCSSIVFCDPSTT